jgi:hypothetical protein
MANKFINTFVELTTTGVIDIYTCPAATVALIKSISVYNNNVASVDITVSIQDNSSSTIFPYAQKANLATLIKQEFLAGDASSILILEESDILKVQSSIADPVVTLSILEQDRT